MVQSEKSLGNGGISCRYYSKSLAEAVQTALGIYRGMFPKFSCLKTIVIEYVPSAKRRSCTVQKAWNVNAVCTGIK